MKQNILNAIQGKLNSLVIDDADSSIKYEKSDIDNRFAYKVSLSELYKIFEVRNEDIFKHDTSECITVVFDDNSEVSLHRFSEETANKPVFLKITNDLMKVHGNEILISLDKDIIEYACKWQNFTVSSALTPDDNYLVTEYYEANLDFNGQSNCETLMGAVNLYNINRYNAGHTKFKVTLPAIKYCDRKTITVGNTVYYGYLPAIGQLRVLSTIAPMLTYLLEKLDGPDLDYKHHAWWSSTEKSNTEAWMLQNGVSECQEKHFNIFAYPFFKK